MSKITTRLARLERRRTPAGYVAPELYAVPADATPEEAARLEAEAWARAKARGWAGPGVGIVEVIVSASDGAIHTD